MGLLLLAQAQEAQAPPQLTSWEVFHTLLLALLFLSQLVALWVLVLNSRTIASRLTEMCDLLRRRSAAPGDLGGPRMQTGIRSPDQARVSGTRPAQPPAAPDQPAPR